MTREQFVESQRAQRKCLRCGRWFESRGPGHRLCKRCTEAVIGLTLLPVYRYEEGERAECEGVLIYEGRA